jgi:hypothetical protein
VTRIGIAITAANALMLAIEFLGRRRSALPLYGWTGLALLVAAEWLMFHGTWPVTVYFTPIAWTAYLLLIDAMVHAVRGQSRLRDQPADFLAGAALSIPLWLVFEAYNLRLANWTYAGVPMSWAGALLGYGWSFSTITPAILETADLVEAFGWFKPAPPLRFSPAEESWAIGFGAFCLLLPILLPQRVAAYLFVLVWVGFFFLLDPINHRLGRTSLVGDFAQGRRGRFYSLLISGWICGWFWEFWNYWAAAKWYYIFPIMQRYKVFEMPAAGYLGFLPFALECFAMYTTAFGLVEWAGRRIKGL